jgi:hypothetical protein
MGLGGGKRRKSRGERREVEARNKELKIPLKFGMYPYPSIPKRGVILRVTLGILSRRMV